MELAFTARGEQILRCFLAPTTEGFVFGLAHPAIGDIHLTVFFKDGKIRASVKDSSRNPDHVQGRTFTPDILAREIESRLRRLVKPYRANMVAWIMRPALKRKIAAALDFPFRDGAMQIPLEIVRGYVIADLRNTRRWRRVLIHELLDMPTEFGIRIERRRPYFVRPLDERTMLKFTEGQVEAIVDLIMERLGFGDYANYVRAKVADQSNSSPLLSTGGERDSRRTSRSSSSLFSATSRGNLPPTRPNS